VREDSALPQHHFDRILLSAVEEGLSSLGNSSKQAIFFYLETSFQIKKENIPESLPQFKNALEGIFGPGASFLEKIIAKRLHEKLGLSFEDDVSVDFVGCVNNAKKHIVPQGKCLAK